MCLPNCWLVRCNRASRITRRIDGFASGMVFLSAILPVRQFSALAVQATSLTVPNALRGCYTNTRRNEYLLHISKR